MHALYNVQHVQPAFVLHCAERFDLWLQDGKTQSVLRLELKHKQM